MILLMMIEVVSVRLDGVPFLEELVGQYLVVNESHGSMVNVGGE